MFRTNDEVMSQNDEVMSQNDEVMSQNDEMMSQNDEVKSQNDEVMSQNDEIMSQNDEVMSQKDEVMSQNEEVMSKDRIIFVTKEDHEAPSNAELVEDDPNDPYEDHGLILPNGDINWNCPCLGGMASGPCGQQFKDAFSCFHYSKEEVKGSECVDYFRSMQECMQKYPELYPQEDDSEGGPSGGAEAAFAESASTDSASVSVPASEEAAAGSESPAAS
ncbi:hypothetical protein NFI96_012552 [Prochilodus magdalenae]|nr:hypothetical protein NFI96_012552 [Prochilodus magdalenae]